MDLRITSCSKMSNLNGACKFVVLVLMLACTWQSCDGSGAFGFDIHHRFSDPVKQMFSVSNSELPIKGTMDYYAAMAHRDRFFHGRRLAGARTDKTPLTFVTGNATYSIPDLGFLYYANVSVGTPESWYLVALDTGSGLFWLPCDCASNCVRSFEFSPTEILDFNIYSLETSSTGAELSCASSYCEYSESCTSSQPHCPYKIQYLSANTSSSGYLVVDVLHLANHVDPSALIDVKVPFGCGEVQTGSFLKSGAPNGLLGLTRDAISLPGILASQNLTADSFSMCFSRDGIGRISFGDKGSKKQSETPLSNNRLNYYNVSITQVAVGTNVAAADFAAIFDTGTSFTLLSEPAYTLLSEKFNSEVRDRRVEAEPRNVFEFCYEMSSSSRDLVVPTINLTMNGGDRFDVLNPAITVAFEDGTYIYCLAIIKSDHEGINIIGENFMTGYRIVFDHEKMVLGWMKADCGEAVSFSPSYLTPEYIPGSGRSGPPSTPANTFAFIVVLVVHLLSIHLTVL